MGLTGAVVPQLGVDEQIALQWVFPCQEPIGMEVFAVAELLIRQALDGELHRIHWIVATGQHR